MKDIILSFKNRKIARSIVSVFLAFCLLIGSFSFLGGISAFAETGDIWGGQSDLSAPLDTNADGIYEITKGSELAYIIKNGGTGKSYILTDDIYLNDVDKVNWQDGTKANDYTVNSWYGNYESTAFSGKIDGNGHIVYGLYFNIAPSYGAYYNYTVGLFPAVDGNAEIKNLGIDKAYVNYEGFAAAFVGLGKSGATLSIDGCFVGKDVTVKAYGAGAFRGSSANMTTTISNSYSLATLNANGGYNGFISNVWGGVTISNSYNAGGAIIADPNRDYVTIENCYQTVNGGTTDSGATTITADNMKGKDVFTNAAKMPNLNGNEVFTAQNGFPVLSVFTSLIDTEPTPEPTPDPEASKVWGGQSDLSAPLDTNADGVYEITKGSELAYIIKNGGMGESFILTNDIYLNDVTTINWAEGVAEGGHTINSWYGNYESTAFSGKVDGNGHIVYGLYFNSAPSYGAYYNYTVGLFPAVDGNAEIKNLGIDKAYVNYEGFAAAFVGLGKSGATLTIDGCFVGKDVTVKAYGAGAFRGYAAGMSTTISNSYSLAKVASNGGGYGLVASVWGALNISNAYNANGPLVSETDDYYSTVTSCYQTVNGGVAGAETITADNMKGKDVFTNAAKMPNLNGNEVFTAQNGFPVLSVFTSLIDTEPTPEPTPDPVVSNIWGGQSDLSAPIDSDADGVYEITKGSELAYIIKNGGAGNSYILTEDIYLNDVDKVNWQDGTKADGYTINSWYGNYESTAFSGKVDGNGHTVFGLYFNIGTSYGAYYTYTVGLFPAVEGTAEIKNLAVDKAFINYESFAAAFVGLGAAGSTLTIDGCFVGKDVYITAFGPSAFRSSSRGMDTTISNCYNLGTMNAMGGSYGLASFVWGNLNISNSFNATGPILSDTNDYEVTISNSYQSVSGGVNTGAVTLLADAMQGVDALINAEKMPLLNKTGYYIATESYPEFAVFNGLPITPPTPTPDPEPEPDPDPTPDPEPTPVDPRAWDGSLEEPKDSDQNGVYEITKASEFAFVIKNGGLGKKYKLTEDIYLNDITKINWQTGVAESGYTVNSWYDANNAAKFKGSIDGAGHTVYGMYHNAGNTTFSNYVPYSIALIPSIAPSTTVTIKNLAVDNVYIHYECFASVFVGENGADSAVVFENCAVRENVSVNAYSAVAFRGYTYNGATSINNCYSLATLNANGGFSGFVANVWGETEILNSYNAGGAIIADPVRDYVTIKNCYQTVNGGAEDSGATTITIDNMKGMDALTNAEKMPKLNEDNVYIAGEGFPVNYVFTSAFVDSDDTETTDPRVWDGSIADALKGNGTEKDPYLISNGSELAFAITSGGRGAYYKLTDDIYLNDVTKMDWATGKPSSVGYRANSWFYDVAFEGTINGDGHTVYGLYYKTSAEDKNFFYGHYGVGLIPKVEDGKSVTVSKLGVENAYVSFECGSSAIVGFAGKDSKLYFDQCYVGENTTIRGNCAGALRGLCEDAEIIISNCYALGKTECFGTGATRGLLGNVWGPLTIISSYNANGPLTNSYERYNVVFENCYQTETGVEGETGVTTISADNMKGMDVLTNTAKMHTINLYEAYVATEGFPVLSIFVGGKGAISFTDEGVKGRVWSGKLATKFAGGSGTEADPYLIETPEQLALLVSKGSGDGDNFYKLTADIYLNDTTKAGWEKGANQWFAGMSAFRGTFDGDGHVVSGLYYNGEHDKKSYAVGLFQRLGADSTVMRVGVVNSKILAKSESGIALVGTIVGWAEDYNPDGNKDKKAPIISECFADHTVVIEGTSAGGILGGAPTRVEIKNCYFTGELTGKNFAGGIVGDAWAGDGHGPILTNCYAATLDRDASGGGDAFAEKKVAAGVSTLTNVYVDGIDLSGAANMLSVMYMRGTEAKLNLKGFDFGSVWQTVGGGSPVLKCFAGAEKYSCKREPKTVSISFANLGGIKVDAVTGIPGYTKITEDTIPKPYRYGYLFKGWHHFNEYGANFELEVFPDFDITLYAEWEEVGFTVSFENDFDEKYDFNSGFELYKPGMTGYKPEYVRSGWRSLHAKADSTVDPTFLISYKHPLEVGKEYHISLWLSTDTEGVSGKVKFIHSNNPDVNLEGIGSQVAFEYSGLQVGEWTKYEVKFIANAPYILVSSPMGQSIFFEDLHIVPTGEEGELGGLDKIANTGSFMSANGNLGLYIVIAVSAVVLAIIATILIVVIAKKRKKTV